MPELLVRVFSFSYRKGLPADPGEHGGGFVFDMRCLPNPGRLAEFKQKTGVDPDVAAWLEQQSEVHQYWHAMSELVTQAVQAYSALGFDSLSVGFGCTGGQHRSVYFAERLSRWLQPMPGLRVDLIHIEQPQLCRR